MEWYQPELADDSWPVLTAPHSDIAMFQPRRPAVWHRHFVLPPEWKARQPRTWLYVFSLNRAKDERAPMFLNGKKVGEPVMGGIRNWTVAEVTSALKPGENLLALRLPQNFLGYRVYLTGQAPAHRQGQAARPGQRSSGQPAGHGGGPVSRQEPRSEGRPAVRREGSGSSGHPGAPRPANTSAHRPAGSPGARPRTPALLSK